MNIRLLFFKVIKLLISILLIELYFIILQLTTQKEYGSFYASSNK
jgi:hypothetical protein